MQKVYYDLHIHTCLSPCGDVDSTPNNVVNMAKIKGLDVIAITDHNTMGNVEACVKVGEKVGLTVIPGMELTTAEEVHIVCLFKTVKDANLFWQEVEKRQPKIKNKEEVFGEQVFLDENDEEIKREERLLIVATTIGVYDVVNLVNKFGGVCYPAHIDRTSNGILAILGGMDKDMGFEFAEVSRKAKNVQELNPLGLKILRASDAHHIGHIFEMEEADSVEISSLDINSVFKALFNK